MNTLSVTEKETIVGLLRLGGSIRRVSRETGSRHETIRRYGFARGLKPIDTFRWTKRRDKTRSRGNRRFKFGKGANRDRQRRSPTQLLPACEVARQCLSEPSLARVELAAICGGIELSLKG